MHKLIIAAALITTVSSASAETVYATRAMNPKLDGFTAGVTPAGARQANTGVQPTCRNVVGTFRYPDGTVRTESKQRCD